MFLGLRSGRNDEDELLVENRFWREVRIVVKKARGRDGFSLASLADEDTEDGGFRDSLGERDLVDVQRMLRHIPQVNRHHLFVVVGVEDAGVSAVVGTER
jgi:hypothetical protein